MLNGGILTDQFYRGNGKLLVGLWKSTTKLTLDVHLLNPKYIPHCLVTDRFEKKRSMPSICVAT